MLGKPDLAKARDDLGGFAKLVGWTMVRFQLVALRLEARVTFILGPRQSGKSRSAALLGTWRAYREPGHHVLIVSASDLGAKRLLALIADLVVSSPLLSASIVDEQASLIRLTNGSTIRSVPASTKAIRGWSIDTLILDEATELGDEIIDVALPTTAARPDARIVFLSTGGAPVGRAYETYMAGLDPRSDLVRSHSWRLKDAKWVSKAAIEQARLTMPPWRFEAEYEGQWSGAVDALFPPELLRRASADLHLPDLAQLRGPARLLGGVDWADAGPDQTAVIAIARVQARGEVRGPVFVAFPIYHAPIGTEVTAAAREIARSGARWNVLSYETNGLGAGAGQLLRDEIRRIRMGEQAEWTLNGGDPMAFHGPVLKVNPTVTTWERKADALGRLRTLAEGGQIVFAREERFMRQLASVRVEHRQFSVGIEAPPGGHDDLVDALYIASGSWTDGGQIRNVLAEFARRHLPEPDLPEPTDTVELESGLVLPRRPHLISVVGDDVTLPIGSELAVEEINPATAFARRARAVIAGRKNA